MKRITILTTILMVTLLAVPAAFALPVYNPTTGHYYEAISYEICLEDPDWTTAKGLAEGMSYLGAQGYLATVTSSEENAWIYSTFNAPLEYWLGGTDQNTEGVWEWVTGETWSYTNWATGQPNNDGAEDYLVYWTQDGKWNDWKNDGDNFLIFTNQANGFIVEYEPSAVPEPLSMFLFGSGLLGFLGFNRKRKTNK